MSAVATAIVGGAVVGGYMSSEAQKDAAETAASAQTAASDASIAEQQRQFDLMQETLSPYVSAGETALTQQMALAGLSGTAAQETAIANIEQSPLFQAQVAAGEEALLQNASATGGLRGGNTAAALAQYRPQMLSQEIQNTYSQLGGLTSIGQASAAGQAAAGMQSATNIGNQLTAAGQANAASALATGQANAQMYSGIAQTGTQLGTLKLLGAF